MSAGEVVEIQKGTYDVCEHLLAGVVAVVARIASPLIAEIIDRAQPLLLDLARQKFAPLIASRRTVVILATRVGFDYSHLSCLTGARDRP